MFFPHDILVRFPSLGQAWLAATLGTSEHCKKLSKVTIIEFNIIEACEFLLNPPHPMSIRLTSQLMLGIVRILKYQTTISLNNCQQVYQRIHAQLILKTSEISQIHLVQEQSHRLHQITLQEDIGVYINMKIDQLLGPRLFESLDTHIIRTPVTSPAITHTVVSSPSIILAGDQLTLIERAVGTTEEPLGLDIEQEFQTQFDLPTPPSSLTIPEGPLVVPIVQKRTPATKKVKVDPTVFFARRDLFRPADIVREESDRELQDYENKRKIREDLKQYLKIFEEPVIPLGNAHEEKFVKDALRRIPPMNLLPELLLQLSASPSLGLSPIPLAEGAGESFDVEQIRRERTLSPFESTLAMPWNLEGYESFLETEARDQPSFISFIRSHQSQFLMQSPILSIPIELLINRTIQPTSPIPNIESYEEGSQIQLTHNQLYLNQDVGNYFKLIKDFSIHHNTESVGFKDLVHISSPKSIASRAFFHLLVLRTKGLVQVSQGKPYDEINITPI